MTHCTKTTQSACGICLFRATVHHPRGNEIPSSAEKKCHHSRNSSFWKWHEHQKWAWPRAMHFGAPGHRTVLTAGTCGADRFSRTSSRSRGSVSEDHFGANIFPAKLDYITTQIPEVDAILHSSFVIAIIIKFHLRGSLA